MKRSKIVKSTKITHVRKPALQTFVPGLTDMPGWVKLSYPKQQALVKITSDLHQFRTTKNVALFGEVMKVAEGLELLEGEDVNVWNWLKIEYAKTSERTVYRRQERYREMMKRIHPASLKQLVAWINEFPDHFENILNSAIGDFNNALDEVPQLALPASTTKQLIGNLELLDEKTAEKRQERLQGTKATLDENELAKKAAHDLAGYIDKSGLTKSAERREWLIKVVGWAMMARAVSGIIENIQQIPIPGGILVPRGRPKGSKTRLGRPPGSKNRPK